MISIFSYVDIYFENFIGAVNANHEYFNMEKKKIEMACMFEFAKY